MKGLLLRLLIYFGILLVLTSGFLYWQRTTPKRLSFKTTKFSQEKVLGESSEDARPLYFVIEGLDIRLPIFPANINNGKWQASSQGISYLASSPVPGEQGNSILYGHNWESILGELVNAERGKEIKILYSDDSVKRFNINDIRTVSPDETSILDPSDDKRITVYTCTGFLDSKRFVVTAKLQ